MTASRRLMAERHRSATVRIVIRGDARSLQRALKGADARIHHLADSRVGDALRRAATREAVVRKALGEFD